jgi:Transcriptional regulator, AbiEi antitoxin
MTEPWRSGSQGWNQNAKVRVSQLTERQHGRVSWAQLTTLKISKAGVNRWVREGYLHRLHPGVYAVGHCAWTPEGDLAAALLYAGAGAALGGATALWWLALIDRQPPMIEVSTPNRRGSRPGLKIHDRRDPNRTWHRDYRSRRWRSHCSNTRSARRTIGSAACSPRPTTAVCSTSTLPARSWVGGAPEAPSSARHSPVISPDSPSPAACSRSGFCRSANPPGYRCRNATRPSKG